MQIQNVLRKGCKNIIKYKNKFSEEAKNELKNIINNVNEYLNTIIDINDKTKLQMTMN